MGPEAKIEIPARANGLFDFEGEPAVVLGKRAKDIKAKDFPAYVWGVTMLIDWSVRDEVWPPAPANPLIFAKNFDCSKSIGPCIAVDEVNVDDWQVDTVVNGKLRQSHSTRDMIFSFGEVLEYLSQDFTFFPGDMLSGGTGAGTGIDTMVPNKDGTWPRDTYLKPGDTVEVKSAALGSLVGHVVPKST
jgi:2-keto-4-pentenoate hydratase/2-oxohepta-3-ene-1,7-dioic acid hydratase in catechol pathway